MAETNKDMVTNLLGEKAEKVPLTQEERLKRLGLMKAYFASLGVALDALKDTRQYVTAIAEEEPFLVGELLTSFMGVVLPLAELRAAIKAAIDQCEIDVLQAADSTVN